MFDSLCEDGEVGTPESLPELAVWVQNHPYAVFSSRGFVAQFSNAACAEATAAFRTIFIGETGARRWEPLRCWVVKEVG